MHTDPTQVIKAEEHLKHFEEDLKMRIQFEAHVDEITHELVDLAKDLKEQRRQDSVIRMKDAITNYQSKQTLDTLKKYWDDYLEEAKKNQ